MITEENIKEADEVLMKYKDTSEGHTYNYLNAIRDRQSVLDYLNNAYLSNKIDVLDTDVLNNLTQQITYLKQNI